MSRIQLFAIFAAIVLVVLLLLAPNKPPLKAPVPAAAGSQTPDEKLEQAVSFVKEGKDPMKGILLLREILQNDPDHVKANFYLGVFSAQSGQWEKARQRFQKVLALDSTEYESLFYLGEAEIRLGDTASAILNFEKYSNVLTDNDKQKEIQKYINELKNK